MSRATDKARAEVVKALAEVERWEQAVTDAEAAAQVTQSMVAEDPADLDRVADAASRAAAKAGAARRSLASARERLSAARPAALLAEAGEEDTAAKAARKERDAHQRKVQALLDQLEHLDGVEYTMKRNDEPLQPGETRVVKVSVFWQLGNRARRHEIRAAVLRYVADRGERPSYRRDLHEHGLDVDFLDSYESLTPDEVPESALEYLAAIRPPEPVEPDPEPVSTAPTLYADLNAAIEAQNRQAGYV